MRLGKLESLNDKAISVYNMNKMVRFQRNCGAASVGSTHGPYIAAARGAIVSFRFNLV